MFNYIYKAYTVGLFFILIAAASYNVKSDYVKGAVVSEVKQNWEFNDNHEFVQLDDTITVTIIGGKSDGNMYSIDVEKGSYNNKDLVELHMNDNGTEYRFDDDEITDIRKVGK